MSLSVETETRLNAATDRSRAIETLRIGRGVLAETGQMVRTLGHQSALVIADENTFAAAGPALTQALAGAGVTTRTHILAATPMPKPSHELASELAGLIGPGELPIALGSGVLNDLVKFAAFSKDIPYLSVPTAVSMDGYTSAGAPLTVGGFKKTLACRPPRAISADLNVLTAAPPAMAGWGFADLAAKIPAGADWILADAAGVEPLAEPAWSLVQDGLAPWLETAPQVKAADPQALAELFGRLALVGFAMEDHGSSRPASGADHQIAHLWEMEGLTQNSIRVSHGACVAVGAMAVLRLYDWFLEQDLTGLEIDRLVAAHRVDEEEIRTLFPNPTLAERAIEETQAKPPGGAALRLRLTRLSENWPETAAKLRAHLLSADNFAELLRAAGAPSEPAHIGVSEEDLLRKVRAARFFRNRYTLLDTLAETGLLPRALSEVFGA